MWSGEPLPRRAAHFIVTALAKYTKNIEIFLHSFTLKIIDFPLGMLYNIITGLREPKNKKGGFNMTIGTIVNMVLTMNEDGFESTMAVDTQRLGSDVLPTLTITATIWSYHGWFSEMQAEQLHSLNSFLEAQSESVWGTTGEDFTKEMIFKMPSFFVVTKCTLKD